MRLRLAFAMLLASATAATAQQPCPVCEPSSQLRAELRKLDFGDEQKTQGARLALEGLRMLLNFRDHLPSHEQGSKAFEALVHLSLYAAPFTPDNQYEKALAAIGNKSAAYRKQYQKLIRKGLRVRDRRESCQVRYLQTFVSMQECKLREFARDGSEELAHNRCHASYSLHDCLARKK